MNRSTDFMPVFLSLNQASLIQFVPWQTEFHASPSTLHAHEKIPYGVSTWGADNASFRVWLSWNWAILDQGIIASIDHHAMRSNIVFRNDTNQQLSVHESAPILLSIVNKLAWRELASDAHQKHLLANNRLKAGCNICAPCY